MFLTKINGLRVPSKSRITLKILICGDVFSVILVNPSPYTMSGEYWFRRETGEFIPRFCGSGRYICCYEKSTVDEEERVMIHDWYLILRPTLGANVTVNKIEGRLGSAGGATGINATTDLFEVISSVKFWADLKDIYFVRPLRWWIFGCYKHKN